MAFYLTVVSLFVSAVSATGPKVEWQSDYGKALAATRGDDRPLLVVLDVPGNKKTAVEEKQLEITGEQGKLLSSYQLCHVDASTKYGKKVAEVFKAEQLPFAAIIDKTGSVVLCKKTGQLSTDEWQDVLKTYEKGERAKPAKVHTSAYRGGMFSGEGSSTSVVSPSYCPSCQLKAQRN